MDIEKRADELAECLLGARHTNHDAKLIAALVRELIPPNHILYDDGVVRKVLGTLPLTADGCVAGLGASVSWRGFGEEYVYDGHVRYSLVWAASVPVESSQPVRDCYSTREAAERAGKEVGE